MKAELPINEAARLEALRGYRILDTLPEACFDDITWLASEICGTSISLVSLIDSDRQWFKSRQGLEVSETPRHVAFCAHAILQPGLMVVPDARDDERFAQNPLVTEAPRIRFYAGAPLVTPKGEALGTLCVIDQARRTLTQAQADSLRALSRQVMAQLELRRHVAEQERYQRRLVEYQEKLQETNARLEAESLSDDVTGFQNTRFLHRHLDQWLRRATAETDELSLVFFDLDGFKEVVDTHGHLLGARALKEIAQVVHRCLGTDDRLVRYGGDEYVVILPGQGRDRARVKAERMRQAICSAAFLSDEKLGVRLTASFGLATFPEDARDKRQLLMEADRCLFVSKRQGKNRVCDNLKA
jgi:diguanylate cyclase (GGDEF)-like protein